MTFLKRLSFLVLASSLFLGASPAYSSHGAVSKVTLIGAYLGFDIIVSESIRATSKYGIKLW